MKIVYIEDKRRPERNLKYKEIISRLELDSFFEYYDTTEPDVISSLNPDGIICHSGMDGYNIIFYFAKKNKWPLLSYSGSVGSTSYLRRSKSNTNLFSVDSEYFESVIKEFVEYCKNSQEESGE
ncbi:hypothetical protein KW542_09135 [Vibrio fluvialis]|nr:hypothetical protein [Vibrio fluvialis]EKO3473045.1 hypothetical protein [Vibrio fluvialis]MBY8115745.1 hypothetical protein [Vibrio fluvialis]MBY8248516.1 hypothetical protein [Vibrio fluvialis]MBY8282506.1 hypothetical protein [Vibrio fluvialis]